MSAYFKDYLNAVEHALKAGNATEHNSPARPEGPA